MACRRLQDSVVLLCAAMALSLSPTICRADDLKSYTLETFTNWLKQYQNAKPDFKPGDVLTVKDIDRLKPLIPPGYLQKLNFPEVRMEIVAPYDDKPAQVFTDCTEKYGRQTRLNSVGALENFRCGQPFPNSSITANDPQAGLKAAWNFEYRWQSYGLYEAENLWIWVRPGNNHVAAPKDASFAPTDPFAISLNDKMPLGIDKDMGGGGYFQRALQGWYKRTFFSHLAQLDGRPLPIPSAQDFQFKEWTGFVDPFDIRGTSFIIYRYADPFRADDAWAYIPVLRRVRRISSEVKSDSLLGTDLTLDDFYGFAGRELDWNWRFLGAKDVLNQYNPRQDYAKTYGPEGMIVDDVWELRRQYAILRTPKNPRHPYSAVLLFFDPQTNQWTLQFCFDRAGKLWKIITWQWMYTELRKHFTEINHGVYAMNWNGLAVFDVQNDRGTLLKGYGDGFPNVDVGKLEALYDINKLEEMHR